MLAQLLVISFVVNKDGMIGDISIVREGVEGFMEQLTCIVSEMPQPWVPCRKNGLPANVEFVITYEDLF